MPYGYDFNVQPAQIESPIARYGKIMQLRQAQQESQANQIKLKEAQRQEAAIANQKAAATAAYQPQSYTPQAQSIQVGGANLGYQPAQVQGPNAFNRGAYLGALQKTDPMGAMQADQAFQAQDIEHQKQMAALSEAMGKASGEQLKNLGTALDLQGRYIGAVDQAPDQLKPQIYAQAREAAVQAGIPGSEQLPPQYDPATFDALKAKFMDVKQAADLANKTLDQNITMRGQDMTAQTARRGQDLTNSRARDANAVAAQKKDASQEAIEAAAQTLANPNSAADLTSLKDIASMRGDQRLLIFNRARTLNPNFSTSDVARKIKMLDDFTNGKDGQNLQSLGTFLEHAGEASDVVNQYRASSSPLINKPLNWFRKNASGDPNFIQFAASLEPVRKEFEGFLLGGRALYGDDRKAAETILSDDASPAQIQAALKQMGHTVKARYNESNYRYKRVMGSDLQDAVSPEALEGAKKIGVSMGASGPTLTNQGGGVSVTDPQGGVHTFPNQAAADNFKKLAGIK